MAAEIALVTLFVSLLGVCVAVLVWDIQRRRIGRESEVQTVADLQLRLAELEEENRHLKEELAFLERVAKRSPRGGEEGRGRP